MTALYPSESEIAKLVLGPERAREWPAKATYLENHKNFPKIDALFGGRYWPLVERWFQQHNGLDVSPAPSVQTLGSKRIRVLPFPPDGEETPDAEKEAAARHQRRERRSHGARA